MRITPYSILSSIVFSSLYLSVLCIMRSRFHFKKKSQVTVFSALYLFGFLRLLLPLEFAFTNGIPLHGVFSAVWKVLFMSRGRIFGLEFSIIDGVAAVMLLISLIRLLYFMKKNRLAEMYMEMHFTVPLEELGSVFRELSSEFGDIDAEIVFCDVICSPFTTGLLHKKIVLPNIELTDEELLCILRHELMHIRRHDLFKKWLLTFFRFIFWWIPFHSFLCRDMEQLMEIHCDNQVTEGLSVRERAAYMRTFFNVTRKISLSRQEDTVSMCFVLQEEHEAIIERFQMMAEGSAKKPSALKFLILLALFVVFVTYMVVPLPKIEPVGSDYGENSLIIEADSTYVLLKEEQYYMVSPGMEPVPLESEEAQCLIANGFVLKEK